MEQQKSRWKLVFSNHFSLKLLNYIIENFLLTGLRAVYDLSKPVNQRVVLIETLCTSCVVPRYEKFDLNNIYTVVLPRYLWKGNQKFSMLREQPLKSINLRRKL